MTADRAVDILRQKSLTLAAAESCTGGLFGAAVTDVAGAGDVYLGGVVCYANSVKTDVLGVDAALIEQHGAVSGSVAKQMSERVRVLCGAELGVGITGVAGPTESERKPVGLVYIAVAGKGGTTVRECRFERELGRDGIRKSAVETALYMLKECL